MTTEPEETYDEGLRRLAGYLGQTPLRPAIVIVLRARVKYWELRGCGEPVDLGEVDKFTNTKELVLQFALFKMGMAGRGWG